MKNRTGCLLLFVLLVLLLFCGGTAGWLAWRAAQNQPPPFVQIRSPQTGVLTNLNDSLPLEVYAEANRPISRLEVYADGALIAAANGTGNALTLVQSWTVSTPGRHVLVARAFFNADEFADSQVVFVDTADLSGLPVQVNVDDLPRGEGVTEIRVGDLAAAAGTTPAEIARLNPGLPSAPEAVIPPGAPVTLPRRPNPLPSAPPSGSSAPPSAPPSAPDVPPPLPGGPGRDPAAPPASRFNGETHSCGQISVRWTDSADETAYLLYRIAPGEDAQTLLATLPANTLTYTDSTPARGGTYRYLLAPRRPSGSSVTDMVSITLGPECDPAPAAGTTSLRLAMLKIETQKNFTGIYCYVSVNGSRYERIPAGEDLLRPGPGYTTYQLPMQLPSRGQYAFTLPETGSVDLALECWGRNGAVTSSLGVYEGRHPAEDWDGRPLLGRSRVTNPDAPKSYVFNLTYRIYRPVASLDISRIYEGALEPQYLNIPPVLDRLSAPVSSIPAPTNVALEWTFGCDARLYLYDGGGFRCAVSVPRLAWSWLPSATVTQNMLTGFDVKMEFEQPGSPSRRVPGPQFQVDGPNRFLPLTPLPLAYRCGVTVYATVSARTTQGNSAPSAPLILRLPECKQDKLRVRITSIQLTPSARTGQLRDDGDICIACDDRRLEVFGSVYLNGYGERHDSLGHDWTHVLFGTCPGGMTCLTGGSYRPGESSTRLPWLFQRDVPHTGSAILTVSLSDYDINNGPDPLCVGSAEVQLGPLVDRNFRRTLTVSSDFGEASCLVTAEVTIAP
ncbi:MAG: hypothetical protein NZP74_14195 [Anaerolineales bacterium]|nr:hypothetical protein [Anaerolineales bacterium]MDW8277475.1 hypothetical protein [Anaerolineales bacterium]